MKKRYIVRLTLDERDQIEDLADRGREADYRRRHARVLILVDEGVHGPGLVNWEAAEQVGFSRRTVEQICERFVTEGLHSAPERRKRSRERSRALDGVIAKPYW